MSGWIGARAYMLWPRNEIGPRITRIAIAPARTRAAARVIARVLGLPVTAIPGIRGVSLAHVGPIRIVLRRSGQRLRSADAPVPGQKPFLLASPVPAPDAAALPAMSVPPSRRPSPDVAPKRWSASAFLLARGEGDSGGLSGGQLGGSQAGVRVAYLLDAKHRIALVGRLATPLQGRGAEAAAGLEWQPTRLPVRIVAEERVLLDTGKAAPAAGVVGGFGPLPIGHGLRAEGYGQAGVIARDGGVAYVDSLARVTHPVFTSHGAEVTLGAGAWGGAQPGVTRLDVGPSVGLSVPVGERRLRVALDWRERVAGHARPGSGLALVAGIDF